MLFGDNPLAVETLADVYWLSGPPTVWEDLDKNTTIWSDVSTNTGVWQSIDKSTAYWSDV